LGSTGAQRGSGGGGGNTSTETNEINARSGDKLFLKTATKGTSNAAAAQAIATGKEYEG